MKDVSLFLLMFKDRIPADKMLFLKKCLQNASEDDLEQLALLPLKSPMLGFLLGFFLGCFAVDRFYKGDIFLGILKLLFGWMTFGIWWFADLFLVWKGIKRDNFEKIMACL